jgi:uncharacterized Ntn-hydrolase superfamily protein
MKPAEIATLLAGMEATASGHTAPRESVAIAIATLVREYLAAQDAWSLHRTVNKLRIDTMTDHSPQWERMTAAIHAMRLAVHTGRR